jgi:hypothetical protein
MAACGAQSIHPGVDDQMGVVSLAVEYVDVDVPVRMPEDHGRNARMEQGS